MACFGTDFPSSCFVVQRLFPDIECYHGFQHDCNVVAVCPALCPYCYLCVPAFSVSIRRCWPGQLLRFTATSHSDKTGERFYHITGSFAVGIIGFIIAISTMNTAARYVSLYVLLITLCEYANDMIHASFLMAQSYAGFVIFYAWISNTFPRPPSKRAVVLAITNAFSQLGNIAGS